MTMTRPTEAAAYRIEIEYNQNIDMRALITGAATGIAMRGAGYLAGQYEPVDSTSGRHHFVVYGWLK